MVQNQVDAIAFIGKQRAMATKVLRFVDVTKGFWAGFVHVLVHQLMKDGGIDEVQAIGMILLQNQLFCGANTPNGDVTGAQQIGAFDVDHGRLPTGSHGRVVAKL